MNPEERDLLIRIDERVGQMHKAIYGNGQPGALDAIATLKAEMDEVRSRAPTKFERFAGGGTILTIAAAAIAKLLGLPIPTL